MVGGLVLHENCRGDLQCTGTENAERCNTVEHHAQRTCTCNDDYIDIGSKCYKSKIHTIEIICLRTIYFIYLVLTKYHYSLFYWCKS